MKGKHPLWQLRTPDEARAFWQAEFGQGQQADGEGGGGGGAPSGGARARHSETTTLV